MKARRILSAIMVFAMIATFAVNVSAADGVTYYVAVNGNDESGDGSEANPFATIQAAVNKASDGDTVLVKEGNYNVFCPADANNNYTGRAHNLFIGKNITVKGEEGKSVIIYSYQEAYTSTFDARITILVSGTDGVVIDNLTILPCYYPTSILTSLDTVSGSLVNAIVGADSLKYYYNQIIDTMMNYNNGKETSESTIENLTIQNCTIGDIAIPSENWGSAIYFPGAVGNATNFVGMTGGYRIQNNILYGGICLCEGASKDATSDECIIKNNVMYDSLFLNGYRPTGWNYVSLTVFPTVTGNTFKRAGMTTDGHRWFIGSRDGTENALLPADTLTTYIKNNTFKVAEGNEVKAVMGSYAYSATAIEYYSLACEAETTSASPVAKIGDVEYTDLQEAIDAAADGAEVVLLNNVEQNDGILIDSKKLTINLNEKTFTVTEGSSTNYRNFKINGNSVVAIKNGTLIAGGDYSSGAYGTVRTEGTADVTLTGLKLYNYRADGLNVKACSGTTVDISDTEIYSSYGGGVESAGGTIELNDVRVEQKGMYTSPWNSMAISVNGGGKVTVNSGTYSTECVTAEEANGQGTSHGPWVVGVLNSGGTLIINGGTFSNDNFGDNASATYARGAVLADTGATVQINGGTFNALKAIVDIQNNLGDAANNPKAEISGGTFSADPRISASYSSELITIADGYALTENSDGTYTVEKEAPDVVDPAFGTNNGVIKLDATETDYEVVILATIDSLNYRNVGLEVLFNGQTVNKVLDTVYEAVKAKTSEDSEATEIAPSAFGGDGKFIFLSKVTFGITHTSTEEFSFRPFATKLDGTVIYGKTTIDTIGK